ncbi:MAG: molybdopterin-binding protein [Thermodesulfovibrionales bacterium]|nr:molybdopterin-binding protein [Thermodesulfovibrionales bacterium]
MCEDVVCSKPVSDSFLKTISVFDAVGSILAHDITEIEAGGFKGRAFKKGHVVKEEDIDHLLRLGKERLFVLSLQPDEIHEDDAAWRLAIALSGEGITISEPKEGRINLTASYKGLLKIDEKRLFAFNQLGEVMCATLHNNTIVKEGQVVAGTRAIPLIVKRAMVEDAEKICRGANNGKQKSVIEVKRLRRPKAGIVITGNEIYYGRKKDAFSDIISSKIEAMDGDIIDIHIAPDNVDIIESNLKNLIKKGADLLITTGGMSVDPDDVTRFAIKNIGAFDITYGSSVLPGAMFLIGYIKKEDTLSNDLIPIIGIPACGMYHKITIFDIILPRVLAGEKIGRNELAMLGHGGLCLNCRECRYPLCPFGK